MDYRDLKRAGIKMKKKKSNVSDDNIVTKVAKITYAAWHKSNDRLISPLQLTIKLEDDINRIANETYWPTSYFVSSIQLNLYLGTKSGHYA